MLALTFDPLFHLTTGTSLTKLLTRFGVDVMYLWYAILLEYVFLKPKSLLCLSFPVMDTIRHRISTSHVRQRILFSGQPAGEVGECCLVAPLLVSPIKGFHGITQVRLPSPIANGYLHRQPYVALTEMSTFEKPTFICGSTNALFETKTDWYDVLGRYSILNYALCATTAIRSVDLHSLY